MVGKYTGENRIDIAESILEVNYEETKLDWWQAWYLSHDFPFLIVSKSRRIGWSFITALKGLINANDPNRFKYTKQFVSYSLDDAKEKISFAREFYYSLPKRFRKKIVSDTKTALEFEDVGGRTRSRLISLPCKPPRGKGGDISLDEFAFHVKDSEIYTAALPVITRGGQIEIGSTPFGNSGKFYDLLTDEKTYSLFKRVKLYWWHSPALCKDVRKAIEEAPLLTTEQRVEEFGTDLLVEIFKSMPLEDFQQEYENLFRDELSAFITLEMIQACTPLGDDEIKEFRTLDDFILAYDPKDHGDLYAGYDVGRINNASELTIIGYFPEQRIKAVLASISYKNVTFDDQEKTLLKLMNELPVHRLAIDATGLGMNLAENLQKKSHVELKELLSQILLKKILLTVYGLLLIVENICCLLTANYRFRFIRSRKWLPQRNMQGLMWRAMRNTMRISSGVWHLRSMRLELARQREVNFTGNSRKEWQREELKPAA